MVEEKKEEVKKEEKKEEEKKEDEIIEIVLKVDMHCEACARKVARSLKGFPGVEEVRTDYKTSKVVVKGKNADPLKVCERVQKKSGKKVELISPLPKPPEEKVEEKKEEPKQEKKEVEQPPPPPPAVTTVILNVHMHCDACAQGLQKRIRKIKGVECVTTDLGKSQVAVTGIFDDSEKLASEVFKKTRKQVSVVKNEEVKKEEEKKEEEKKDKKEEEEEKKEGDDDNKAETMKKVEYMPPRYYNMEYVNYAPQIFSDENPNACSVM